MKILIVDDHPLVRRGLSSIFAFESDMEVVGECSSVEEALMQIKIKCPDIILVDLRLGKENGLDVIKKLKDQSISPKQIIFTSSVSYDDFIAADQLGVEGYILKEAFPEEFLYAIRLVYRGRKYYDPEVLTYKQRIVNSQYEQLTHREFDVLKILGKGFSNKQIASELFITENTVKKHVSQILSKLDLHDRTQAALYAKNLL